MESKHGSPSKDENNSTNKDDALAPLISVGDSDHDSGNEAEEKTPGSAKSKKSRSSHPDSSSSSSSESSSDLFQMDVKMLKKSSTFPARSPKAEEGSQSPNEKKKSDTTGNMSSKSQDIDNTSPINAISQVSHSPSNPTSQTMSPVQSPRKQVMGRSSSFDRISPPKKVMEKSGSDRISPPKQVMERTGNYDPDRIPASVFGNRPSSAMEWSAASNDSLFSINIGNNSFSREQFLMMSEEFGEDFHKSGELYNSGELNKPGEANKSGLPPLSPIGKLRKVKTMGADKKTMDVDKKPKPKEDEVVVLDQFEAKKRELDRNGNSSMINRSSDASAASSQSFAFPILVDTTKYTSVKGPFPRKQDPKLDVYAESPQMKTNKKKSYSYWRYFCCCCCRCSLPECSCPSSRHCWSWKWLKKWCCCGCL